MKLSGHNTPIIFFGTDEFSLAALAQLIGAGYAIAAVITKPDSKKGRGQKVVYSPVKTLALQHNITVWQPEKLRDIAGDIVNLGTPAGVLSSYGKIIPKAIIDLFEPGIINIHPSLLPLYRGPTPIETAILNGDSKTGVSIMKLLPGMDDGPIYAAKEYPLSQHETKPELYDTLSNLGAELLLEVLPGILGSSLQATNQDESRATYTAMLSKEDALLLPEKHTAYEAERRVRAHLGFPKTKVIIYGHQIIITKAHVSDIEASPLDIACKDGNFLSIDTLIAPSGKHVSATEFERGYLRG